jgi:hypothetical protein
MDRRAKATKQGVLRASMVVAGLALAALATTACEPATDVPVASQVPAPTVWSALLPANPPVDATNATLRASLARQNHDGSFWSNPEHGIVVYHVSSADPVVPIRCTMYCKAGSYPTSFPVPAGGVRIEASDGHLALINATTGTELDFWMATWDGHTLSGSTVIELPSGGSGWCSPPGTFCNSANAAGSMLTAGLITPEDVRGGGRINHALSMVLRTARAGYIACPATHTDGIGATTEVPEGAHLFLPRSFVVPASWPISAKQVAWALQDHGAYVTDQGSWGAMVQANGDFTGTGWESPVHYPADFPWNQLQVSPLTRCG